MRPAVLLLVISAFVWAESDQKEVEKTETDPVVIERKLKAIKEEYEAISSNQDLRQTRRRRELARRLRFLPCEDARKILARIIENDSDLRAVITAMNSQAIIGDMKYIKRMYKHVKKKSFKTVLPDYLGPALAQATDPEVGPWVVDQLLGSSNKFINISAVEAVGSLRTKEAREPLFKMLAKVDKKTRPDMHLRYEILRSLGQIGGEGVAEKLREAAQDDDWRNRLAAAEVMILHDRGPKSIELMRKLLKDEKPIVREVAAIAAGDHKVEPLFKELVVLMREGNLRAKLKSYEAMKKISGEDFGYAPDVWAKWQKDKEKGTVSGTKLGKERISVATYYNFKIFSDRVLFVIDVSGSMKWPDYSPNRIAVAKRELTKAIKALNETTLFNMATFAGHVNMWQKKGEVPATDANKQKALKWIEGALLPRGATNTYGALMDGLLKNPQVDTVYFLSDGIPSTGKYEVPEEILIKLRYANRFRKVIFNTVAIAMGKPSIEKAEKYEDPEEMAAFMKMIADWNGGTCVDIRKPFLDLREDD